MSTMIIYGSHYGNGKRYAEEISKRTGLICKDYQEDIDLINTDRVIYIGSLYAGSCLGLEETLKKFPKNREIELILGTVGLAAPENESNVENIRKGLRKVLPENYYKTENLYHLRGGIDYGKMSRTHKIMMAFMNFMLKRTPKKKITPEIQGFLDSYNKSVEFVDFDSLEPILARI